MHCTSIVQENLAQLGVCFCLFCWSDIRPQLWLATCARSSQVEDQLKIK